ncbi:hypothetical protein [Frankia gtarii]|uniref:hypothetical protein n=1 Tax=Frankia gtarii TaxID=2950102 RepID=UPI0021C03CCA|nr:hypothetical protein [Frankia gtarii]
MGEAVRRALRLDQPVQPAEQLRGARAHWVRFPDDDGVEAPWLRCGRRYGD